MLLLVGLGNPGPKYAGHRHNIGFMAVDELARRHGFAPWRVRFQGQIAEGHLGSHRVLLLKPGTFMNDSGRAVGEAARFFKLSPEQVYVIHDELDLPLGRLRVKRGGGHGGHNGLRSLDAHLGPNYWRLRLGIGHPGNRDRVTGYVLSDFAKAEQSVVEDVLSSAAEAFPTWLDRDEGVFMNKVAVQLQSLTSE